MRKHLFLVSCIFLFSSAIVFANDRTENNGNLILKNIPIIPENIKNDLTRYQNIRSAPFRGFNREGNGIFLSVSYTHLTLPTNREV